MIQDQKKRSLLSNTLTFGLGAVATKVIMFFLLPVYTIYMSNSELGMAELLINTMNLIYPFATLSTQNALLVYILKKENDHKYVLKAVIYVNIVGILLTVIGIYALNRHGTFGNWKGYLSLLLITYTLNQICSIYTKALGKTVLFTIGNIIYTLSLFILSIIFLVCFKRGTQGYIEAILLANIFSALFFLFAASMYACWTKRKVSLRFIREIVFYSLPLIINSVSWWLSSIFDRYVIQFYLGSDAVGMYSVASKLPVIITSFSAIFMQAWVLSSIKEFQDGKDSTFYSDIFKKYSIIMILLGMGLIIFIQPIYYVLIGSGFQESWKYVPMLILSSIFSSFSDFFGAIYMSAKKNTQVMLTTFSGAITNIILNIILIPKFGIQGAVFATMASFLVVFIYRLIGSRKLIHFKINLVKLMVCFILAVLECFIILTISKGYLWGILIWILAIFIQRTELLAVLRSGKKVFVNKINTKKR